MPPRSLTSVLSLWASAYLGCALFLLADLLPQDAVSIALLAQLSWLALLGSIPTTLLLGTAARIARAPRTLVTLSTLAAMVLVAAMAWEHTDFLLSGPRWILHPQHQMIRVGMVAVLGLLGAGGWLWLILGARVTHKIGLATWITLSLVAVELLSAAIARYRAYDYTMARLVFPAGLLCGAMVYLLVRGSRYWPVVIGAAAVCLLCGAGSRFEPALVATGQRAVTAQSRVGALTALYLRPHFNHQEAWPASADTCTEPRPIVERSPIGIAPEHRRNVIIITVDALRKDVIGMEVNGRPVAPELSRLAKAGVSFENATSPYPATLFALGSAFTGLSPAELYLAPSLPDTIFTRSRSRVDQQLAVLPNVSWFQLPIVAQFLTPGVQTTFAPTDSAATDALIERLRAARKDNASVMAWIHYYSPHDPYQSHRAFAFGRGRRNAYLSEVAYVDHELGRLMRYLHEAGWLEDSLLVFFADHGESLGEKSYWGHHVYLNAWMIDVPLLLWNPDLSPAAPSVGVSLSDVAPTVLHFLGVPVPSDIAAQSLFTLDPNAVNRPSFSEAFPVRGRELFDGFRLPSLDDASIRARLRSIRVASKGYEPKDAISRGRYRLIRHRGAKTVLLYDHAIDPDERLGRGTSNEAAGEVLRSELDHWEREQLRRIRCRLDLSEARSATPRHE